MSAKRYYEVEFGVWVEEPDPMRKPACDAPWPDEWDYSQGARPRCFRPEGHAGEHRETRQLVGGEGWMEYYWGSEPGSGRTELRKDAPAEEP
jgi:hypothetical protein